MAQKKNGQEGGISKMEAVRRAMAELGNEATRTEIQRFVKERLAIDMNLDVISTYKADVARRAGRAKGATRTAATPAAKTKPAAIGRSAVKAGGIGLADIQALKALMKRVGAASLKELIDVLAQ